VGDFLRIERTARGVHPRGRFYFRQAVRAMGEEYEWKRVRGERVFENPYYGIDKDRVRHPMGHEVDYYVVRPHRPAAGVVPVAEDGRVLMVRQFRYATGVLSWEVPAGGVNEGEEPAAAAVREMREETGWEAARVEPLYRYHPSQGSSSQTFHLFVGRGLTRVGERDPREIHAVEFVERARVEAMLDRNEIVDGLSVTALLAYLRRG
jgi:8-oxo-dGTP pyrophosphatase MutT (NUDIX family)